MKPPLVIVVLEVRANTTTTMDLSAVRQKLYGASNSTRTCHYQSVGLYRCHSDCEL